MADGDLPRLRFAKREIAKVLVALERVDGSEFSAAMRLLQVEDELADAREQSSRWRRSYEQTQALLEQVADAEDAVKIAALDKAMRTWVGKA